jgi:multidrug efflux pump subunit AcrB
MKRILAAFARNTVFANIVLMLIFVAGAFAVKQMVRETFPQFSLDYIFVTVPYPGADPEEVEEGICRKIEEAIEDVEGIKEYGTTSAESVGTTFIEVKEGYDVQVVMDRVRSKVDSISTFPPDAEKPIITELVHRETVAILSVSGDMPERRLKEWAADMKDELQSLPEISQVVVSGVRDYEIAIELSESRLREYGLSLEQVADAVRRSSLNMPGGTIRTDGEEIRVRTLGRKYRGEEFAGIVVLARPTGEIITLDRLATIVDGFTEDPISTRVNGRRAVFVNVLKTEEQDSIEISEAIKKFIARKEKQLPDGASFTMLLDLSVFLRGRLQLLIRNGAIGITLVFIILWIFLDLRLSFWAGMGMPISVAGALVILWFCGGSLNMISLFGLIMVLGIIVDDAIVVGEAIYVHRKEGSSPLAAAVEGVSEVGLPVIAAVTTTIVAFVPLMYVGGIMGKFIKILPVVVIACLAVSLIECLILLPAHLGELGDLAAKKRSRNPLRRLLSKFHDATSGGLERFVKSVYSPFVARALRWRYVSLCVAVSVLLVTFGLVGGGILKFEVFPGMDGFVVNAKVEFPAGTPPAVTRAAVERIEAAASSLAKRSPTKSGDPLIKYCIAAVGQTMGEIPEYGPNIGGAQIILVDAEDRELRSRDVLLEWEKEIGPIPGATALTFQEMEAGPPGAPIEIWIRGKRMDELLEAADDLMARLKRFDGVRQIQSDFRRGKTEIRLKLKPEARGLNLTVADLGRQVNSAYYGNEAVRIQRGRDDIRVKVRYTEEERSSVSDIRQVRIRTPRGQAVPLLSVADISFEPGYSAISRKDGMRNVAVTAEIDENKANATEVFAELNREYFPDLRRRYPGIFVSQRGEKKKMTESLGSLFVGYPLALLGIYIIIATMFRSYAQPVVIMLTVPFGIIGAFMGHLLLGYKLSMMSLFGIVALSGVVVNDAIVLIERINGNLADGVPFAEAIRSGAVRRFRAVFLTTISTVGGLTPLIMEKDMQARFLIPMALSIAAGVAFATLLTLILIPSLLVVLNDARRLSFRLRRGYWPVPEAVEPAARRNEGRDEY